MGRGRGEPGSLNGARMAEYRGDEGLVKRLSGSGGAQAYSFFAKRHIRNQTSEDTKRQRVTLGGRGGRKGYRGNKNTTITPGTGRGLGCRSSLAGRRIRREVHGYNRGSEGPWMG